MQNPAAKAFSPTCPHLTPAAGGKNSQGPFSQCQEQAHTLEGRGAAQLDAGSLTAVVCVLCGHMSLLPALDSGGVA